jgi:hypothetical protein
MRGQRLGRILATAAALVIAVGTLPAPELPKPTDSAFVKEVKLDIIKIEHTFSPPAHAQPFDCSTVTQQILQYGGEWEITGYQTFDSITYVQFEAYFPSVGEWYYGSCFYNNY